MQEFYNKAVEKSKKIKPESKKKKWGGKVIDFVVKHSQFEFNIQFIIIGLCREVS